MDNVASGLATDTSDTTEPQAARGILLLVESNFEVKFAPRTTPRPSPAGCARHCAPRTKQSAKATCPTWFKPVAALLHDRKIVIREPVSDSATSFASVSLDELLAALE